VAGLRVRVRARARVRVRVRVRVSVGVRVHVLGHAWQALLATEEAVRDELLDDRLLAHEVDAII
jgi:hypothetical protein